MAMHAFGFTPKKRYLVYISQAGSEVRAHAKKTHYISSHYFSLKKHVIGRQLEGNVARCLENRSPPAQVATFRVKLQNYTNY